MNRFQGCHLLTFLLLDLAHISWTSCILQLFFFYIKVIMNPVGRYALGSPRGGQNDTIASDPGNEQTTMGSVHVAKSAWTTASWRSTRMIYQQNNRQIYLSILLRYRRQDLESPHSAQNLQVVQIKPSNIKSERRWVIWPSANVT